MTAPFGDAASWMPPRYEHTSSLLARAAAPGPMRAAATRAWADVARAPTRAAFTLGRHLRALSGLKRWERRLVAAGLYALVRSHRLLAAALGVAQDDARRLWLGWLGWQGGDSGLDGAASAALEAIADPASRLAVAASIPDDLAARLLVDLGGDAGPFLLASNRRAPLVLRVDVARTARDSVIARLAADGLEASAHPAAVSALRCARFDVRAHPLHEAGLIEVQDAGSQRIVELVGAGAGEVVVDLCAGAGGKTLGLAAAVGPRGRVYAFDVRRERLAALAERTGRAGLSGRVVVGELPPDGAADRVLVDAPCSGSGTLRREPELRWRLGAARVARFPEQQRELVARGRALLRPGGRLVYATCSVLRAENEAVLEAALPEEQPAEVLRLAPHTHDTDGFFAAAIDTPGRRET